METNPKPSLWRLYRAFFSVGLFTFGGGYAMLPLLEREVVDRQHWATQEELLDCYAIGQSTPGAIAVNTSTYIGYNTRGIRGGLVATLGVITPSLVIILVIAAVLGQIEDLPVVQHAFAGIRAVVGALIIGSVIRLIRADVRSPLQIALCVAAFILVALLGASPIWVIVGAVLVGLAAGGKLVERA